MLEETFAQGGSILHRLDPRLRLLFATAFSFLIAMTTAFPVCFAGVAMASALVLLARLSVIAVLRRLLVVNIFNLLLWAVLPLTYGGENLFNFGSLAFSREGLCLAALITLKSNTILLALIAMVATMSVATLGQAMHRLRVPGKVVYLLLFTYRYVFLIEEEYQRLVMAMKVRGFSPATNLHTCRSYAYLFGMLLVRSLGRADRVCQAMLCRGFQGKFHDLHTFTFTRVDSFWSFLLLLSLLALGNLQWLQHIP
jgi:cobalt/nickel transport system permease protein